MVRSWSHRATKCRQSEPSPQGTKHSVDRAKLSLMSLDDASLTSDTGQVAGALGPRQPVEVRFQRLANLDLATVKQPPEVLGLPHVGVQRDEKTRDLGSVTHRYTKSPTVTHATFIDNRHTAVTATPARGSPGSRHPNGCRIGTVDSGLYG